VLVAVGGHGGDYADGYGEAGEVRLTADAGEAASVVSEVVEPGDILLVKGSRSVALEHVTDELARKMPRAKADA
jgi:UDP-N-acetylmuramoyl-tripeptide--D-alanyl-D-alanine ligase